MVLKRFLHSLRASSLITTKGCGKLSLFGRKIGSGKFNNSEYSFFPNGHSLKIVELPLPYAPTSIEIKPYLHPL